MYHTILCVLASTWPLHGAWCTNYCKLNSNFFWKYKIYLSMVSPSWSVSSWAIPVFVISLNSWISFSSFVYLSCSSYQHSVLSVYFLSLIPWSSYISQPFLTCSYSICDFSCLSSTHNLWRSRWFNSKCLVCNQPLEGSNWHCTLHFFHLLFWIRFFTCSVQLMNYSWKHTGGHVLSLARPFT